jgi:hypothetical protein
MFSSVVRDILAISGDVNTFIKTWSLIMSGGEECLDHDMPDLPIEAQGYGLAQAYDRFVYLCGGYNRQSIGKYILLTFRNILQQLHLT